MKKILYIFALTILSFNHSFAQSVGDQRTSYWNGSLWSTGTFTGTGTQILLKGAGAPQSAAVDSTLNLSSGTLGVASGAFIAATSGTGEGTTLTGTVLSSTSTVLDLSNSTPFATILIPSGTSIKGISYGPTSQGSGLFYETLMYKMRLQSKKIVDILPAQDFLPGGKIQLGNHYGSGEYSFFAQEGDSLSTRINSPSHRVSYEVGFWNGSANVTKYVTTSANTDSSGNPYFSIFAQGSIDGGSISGTTGYYVYSSGTESTRFTIAGIDMLNNGIINIGTGLTFTGTGAAATRAALGVATSGSNTNITELHGLKEADGVPSVTGTTSPTTGLGFFGADWQLSRGSSMQMRSDSTNGIVFAALASFANRAQLSTGSDSLNSLCRLGDASTGLSMVGTGSIGIATSGTRRITFDANGVTASTIRINSGSNTLAGTVTLVAGAGTIVSSAIDTNTVISISIKTQGGVLTNAFSPLVTVFSGSATLQGLGTDTSTYNWIGIKATP